MYYPMERYVIYSSVDDTEHLLILKAHLKEDMLKDSSGHRMKPVVEFVAANMDQARSLYRSFMKIDTSNEGYAG